MTRVVAHREAVILAPRCDPSSLRPSGCGLCANPKRPEHRFRIAIDHREKHARSSVRPRPPLFPVAERRGVDREGTGETVLR